MATSNIEKQQLKLEKLNEKIKQEKKKVEQRLGREIIKGADLDYAELNQDSIKKIAEKVSKYLMAQSQNNSDNTQAVTPDVSENEYNQN